MGVHVHPGTPRFGAPANIICTYIDLYLFLQVLALVPVYLLQICYGMNTGFPAILTPQLRENCSEFSITSDQESWIVSIDNLATPLICILSGFLQQKFGPQRVIIKYFLHWNNNFDVKSCFVGVFFHSQINFFLNFCTLKFWWEKWIWTLFHEWN